MPISIVLYEAKNCNNCPLNGAYYKAKGNRQISVDHALKQYKEQAWQNLQSEQVIYHRIKRCYDVESVFAN